MKTDNPSPFGRDAYVLFQSWILKQGRNYHVELKVKVCAFWCGISNNIHIRIEWKKKNVYRTFSSEQPSDDFTMLPVVLLKGSCNLEG